MPRILIVEDDEACRRDLSLALGDDGHEVRTAASGREAIDTGVRFQPEVLLTDWMLRGDLHGLHVAQVLHAVWPETRVLLMTAFPSEHLRAEAARSHVIEFIEKPFSLEQIREAVVRAVKLDASGPHQATVAVLWLDGAGRILSANGRASAMLAEVGSGRGQRDTFADLFSPDVAPNLDAATDRWVPSRPQAERPTCWYVRSQEPLADGSRLVVLQLADEPRLASAGLLGMLLGFSPAERTRWPFDRRVLVIDSDGLNRTWFVAMLESCGAGCYAVESFERGLHLLGGDVGLQFVLVNCPKPALPWQACVESLRHARSDAVIVAVTDDSEREEALAAGVEHLLPRVWRVEDLIRLLTKP